MLKLVFIAMGGSVGALLRYGISSWTQRMSNSSFPWGTLTVNVCGCFLIGLISALLAGQYLREEWRPFLLIGIMGSFTTFSTFGFETFELANEGQFTRAGINILLSNLAGLTAVWIGYRLTVQVVGG